MRLLSWSIIALALGLPSTAFAQAVTRDDLIGNWIHTLTWKDANGRQMTQQEILTFRADSTWTRLYKLNGQDDSTSSHKGLWYLSNDSLWFGDPTVTDTVYNQYMGGSIVSIVPKWPSLKIDLRSERLRMAEYSLFTKWQEDHQGKTPFPSMWFQEYTRSTESKP